MKIEIPVPLNYKVDRGTTEIAHTIEKDNIFFHLQYVFFGICLPVGYSPFGRRGACCLVLRVLFANVHIIYRFLAESAKDGKL